MPKPPFEITSEILELVSSISEKIGQISALSFQKVSPELRKKNRIKTIQASLEIEGNTLSLDQITDLIENKRVAGPQKDIREVQNAIKVYDKLSAYDPGSLEDFLLAHKILMMGLIDRPGKLRKTSVGIAKGSELAHLAPPPDQLQFLMTDLMSYALNGEDHVLVKSSVVHYEIEFIHPFVDGNGRMGRLWQTLILMQKYPVFEYLPFETLIKQRQKEYYQALSQSEKQGKSTIFITFMLENLEDSLSELLPLSHLPKSPKERIDHFLSIYPKRNFSRKDYLEVYTHISSATASRDLRFAVEQNFIKKLGDKRTTQYEKS